ncbi:MAG: Gamma-glutamylcyclotransferase family protein YtfP [Pelotomaculum sp. PtaU1.Bin065]|nr:MAG: Gamma-glutamylcyclotransferase family protein YtfP [Pelotomaculum sp. PtaU1.Bin065]
MNAKGRGKGYELVFVYGTLLSGHRNNYYLKNSKFVSIGKVKGLALYDVTESYPGVVQEENSTVIGEVYEVNSTTLKLLDRLESNGYLYRREKFSVMIKGAAVVEAWTYLWLRPVTGAMVPLDKQPWRKVESRCS